MKKEPEGKARKVIDDGLVQFLNIHYLYNFIHQLYTAEPETQAKAPALQNLC